MFVPETGRRLDEQTDVEPDFVVFDRRVGLPPLRGPDVLLAVEVADSSFEYDLGRKSLIFAEYGVGKLWVIDAASRVVHVHLGPGPGGLCLETVRQASERLEPTHAPLAFAFAVDELNQSRIGPALGQTAGAGRRHILAGRMLAGRSASSFRLADRDEGQYLRLARAH